MNNRIAAQLVEAGEEHGLELSLYEGYSGRGMYGEETTGIQCDDDATLMQAFLFLGFSLGKTNDEDTLEEVRETLEVIRSDNLGLRKIFY